MADDYSPWTTGDTLTPLSAQFESKDGTAIDITGSTFTAEMVGIINGSVTRKAMLGIWIIDNPTAGQAHVNLNAADVNTAAAWTLQVTRTVSGQTQHFDPKPWIIADPI